MSADSNRRTALTLGAALFLLTACDSAKTPSGAPSASPPAAAGPAVAASTNNQTPPATTPPAAAPATPAAAPAATPPASTTPLVPGPRWACDELTHSFGEVWQGRMVAHPFIIKNIGDQQLEILTAKPRCSCSVAENFDKIIPPGGTGQIPFRLMTNNKHGPVEEYLTITLNDPVHPEMKITLVGTVRTVTNLEVLSDAIYEKNRAAGDTKTPFPIQAGAAFGRVQPTDVIHRVVKMTNPLETPLQLTMNPMKPDSRFKVDFKETNPGKEFQLTVHCDPPFAPGRTDDVISFNTNLPEMALYQVSIYVYVPPRIEIIPTKIVVDDNSWTIKERLIRITNNGDTPFSVKSISTSEPAFNLRMDPPNPAEPKVTNIRLTLPGDRYYPPAYGELVRIETNDPEFPQFELMVLPHLYNPATPRPADKPLILQAGKMN